MLFGLKNAPVAFHKLMSTSVLFDINLFIILSSDFVSNPDCVFKPIKAHTPFSFELWMFLFT